MANYVCMYICGYCIVRFLHFLKTFKYEFIDCKQSKNKYVFSFTLSYVPPFKFIPCIQQESQQKLIIFCKHNTYPLDFHMQPQLYTRLTELPLTASRFVFLFYIRTPSVCIMFLKLKVRILPF